jgi:hypothetical protein
MTWVRGANCGSHQHDKVKHSIPCPNTPTHQCIEESLNYVEQGVAHTTSILEVDCPASYWHMARLPYTFAKTYWAMQVNTRFLCNGGTSKHGTPSPICKWTKKISWLPIMWSMGFGFTTMTLNIM